MLCEKSIFGPISGWALLSFVSFFCLFDCFFHFSHFLFISSFFDFLMFFIFLVDFFLKKKVSSFLFFSCISFKYVLLLALVSEFNCFLRSRCSMEMWCPDDTGRDNWDWVGPPAWVRACFNSPEWNGGSSPVKTEPPQDELLLLLLFWTMIHECVYPHPELQRLCINYCKQPTCTSPGGVGLCNLIFSQFP